MGAQALAEKQEVVQHVLPILQDILLLGLDRVLLRSVAAAVRVPAAGGAAHGAAMFDVAQLRPGRCTRAEPHPACRPPTPT